MGIALGDKIRVVRSVHKLSKSELSRRLKIRRDILGNIENNLALPTEEQKRDIEDLFGVQFDDPAVAQAIAVLAGMHSSLDTALAA